MLTTTLDRRRALGLLAGGVLATGVPMPAAAGRSWCRVDPILRIAGQEIHLWVGLWAKNMTAAQRAANGPIEVAFALPPLVPYERLDDHPGFGEGFVVTWEPAADLVATEQLLPVRVRVRIPTRHRRNVPAQTWLQALTAGPVAEGLAYGRSNGWIELATPQLGAARAPAGGAPAG